MRFLRARHSTIPFLVSFAVSVSADFETILRECKMPIVSMEKYFLHLTKIGLYFVRRQIVVSFTYFVVIYVCSERRSVNCAHRCGATWPSQSN